MQLPATPRQLIRIQSATMAVLSTNEEIQSRFAPYVGELHELFGLHGVSFGSPADLPPLMERLDKGGFFAEDVSSILRSIILREGGSVPQTELLEVVALAAAGPTLDPAVPEVQPAFRRLLSFVGTIARRPWNIPPGDLPAASMPDSPAAPAKDPAPLYSGPPTTPTGELIATQSFEPSAGVALAANGNGLSSHTNGLPPGFRPFAPRPDVEESEPAGVDGIPPPKPHSGRNPSWPLWIASACAIVAVLLLVLFDRAHSPKPVISPVTKPLTAASAPNSAAPSPASPNPARPTSAVATTAAPSPASPATSAQPSKPSATVPFPAGRHSVAPAQATNRPPQPNVTQPAAAPSVATAPSTRTTAPQPVPPTHSAETPTPAATTQNARSAPAATTSDSAAAPAISTVAPLRRPAIALPREGGRMAHGGYFQVSSGVMASHLVRSSDPAYPMLARVAHVQGEVILQAVISPEGEVVSTHVLSGPHLLRGAASSAVKQWRYRPFFVDGRPVNVATVVTVDFREHR